ncbi:MAG: MBL fold metallo-hydrolase, partial [Lentisphaerae bacterium]|nr:MBL fold metallo-hydrolase [Lentisphaerota bacterium]
MKIGFLGATSGEVTGSAYHVCTDRAEVMIDFGLFQGGRRADAANRVKALRRAADLDAVLLTHGHLDHCGRLPLLAKAGYRGPVLCTEATREIAALILRDSAHVQEQDLNRTNRRRERAGQEPLEPLYTAADVEAILTQFRAVPYGERLTVAPGIEARFVDAGHLIGSASIELLVHESGRRRQVVFSGDLGRSNAPLMRDPEVFRKADVVVMESTYGDREHKPLDGTVAEFEAIVADAVARHSKILVPTFAVGRAQLMLYLLALMFRNRVVPTFPVFIDSPMAIEATRICERHLDLYDEEFQALQRQKPLAEDMRSVQATATPEQSKRLNDLDGPCLILAGSGMCTAGRILHHLKQNLWREGTSVIFVGFQGQGTLGRQLVEGAKTVKIFGEKIAVRARIYTLGGFSAHAGQSELLDWLGTMAASRPKLVITHGEEKARTALAAKAKERFGLESIIPEAG